MLLASEKNQTKSNKIKEPLYLDDNDIPDTSIINTVIKETMNEDKIMDTSVTPLSKSKENKKPKYSQVNTKIHISHQSSHQGSSKLNKKVQITKEETVNPSTNNNSKKKKKLVYNEKFIEFVDIESYKRFNKAMTYPDGHHQEDDTQDSCKKFKECLEKTCVIY